MCVCFCVQGCGGVQPICWNPEEKAALQVKLCRQSVVIHHLNLISLAATDFVRVCSRNTKRTFICVCVCQCVGFFRHSESKWTEGKSLQIIYVNVCHVKLSVRHHLTTVEWGCRIILAVPHRRSRGSTGSSQGSSRQSSTDTDCRYGNDPPPWSSTDSDSSYQWTSPAPKPRQPANHSWEGRGSGASSELKRRDFVIASYFTPWKCKLRRWDTLLLCSCETENSSPRLHHRAALGKIAVYKLAVFFFVFFKSAASN